MALVSIGTPWCRVDPKESDRREVKAWGMWSGAVPGCRPSGATRVARVETQKSGENR